MRSGYQKGRGCRSEWKDELFDEKVAFNLKDQIRKKRVSEDGMLLKGRRVKAV